MANRKETGKPKVNIKLYLSFAAAVVVIFGIYRVVVSAVNAGLIAPMWYSAIMWAYLLLAGAGFVAVVILNRGFSGGVPTADQLPSAWNHIEKANYIKEAADRRRKAKFFLIPTVAFVFVFIYEIIELYYFPAISDWFSSF